MMKELWFKAAIRGDQLVLVLGNLPRKGNIEIITPYPTESCKNMNMHYRPLKINCMFYLSSRIQFGSDLGKKTHKIIFFGFLWFYSFRHQILNKVGLCCFFFACVHSFSKKSWGKTYNIFWVALDIHPPVVHAKLQSKIEIGKYCMEPVWGPLDR